MPENRLIGKRRIISPVALSKTVWLEHGWPDRPIATEALYDLMFDPNETPNVAHDPDCRKVLADMRTRLEKWMHQTDDPILRGPIPPPPGSNITDADAISPGG